MKIRRAMGVLVAFACAQGVLLPGQGQLPHAFPREGATQVFDNQWGTAWDATWTPNKPTLMHQHAYDYVGVELVDSTFNLTSPGGQPRTASLKKGSSYFLPKGTTHIEEGLSSNPPRHAVLIDLKDQPSPTLPNTTQYPTAFPRDAARKVVENPRVVMWDVAWVPNQPAALYFHDKNAFIIFVDAGELALTAPNDQPQALSVHAGQILFWTGGGVRAERAINGAVRAVVVELK